MLEPSLVDGKRIAVAEDDGPLDDVLQLANIARPTVGLEQIERRFLDALDLLPRTLYGARHQVFHQQGYVIGSFAQRRNGDGEHTQPVAEILAEAGARHC